MVLCADIASTGLGGAEAGGVRIGDAVVILAQGPIGLCATAGARLMGAALVIGVDGDEARLAMARRMGADVALDYRAVDVIAEVKRLTGGGADVAIEALGGQAGSGRATGPEVPWRTTRPPWPVRSRLSDSRSPVWLPVVEATQPVGALRLETLFDQAA